MEIHSRGRRYRGPVRAVILDWAGTAVDHGCVGPVAAFIEAFRTRWVEVTVEEARAPMGLSKMEHVRAMLRMQSITEKWEDVHGAPPGDLDAENLYRSIEPVMGYAVTMHSDLIPGLTDAVETLRKAGIKIGSTTGYSCSMMQALVPAARERGYEPDSVVCASDVPAGRPYPWMCYLNAIHLEVYPLEACVKVGDTLMDIEEGLNAGMWTIGVTRTGNELGLTEQEAAALDPEDLNNRLSEIQRRFIAAGAHFVVEGIWEVPAVVREIEDLLDRGEKP